MYSTQSGTPRARAGDNYYLTAPRTSVNIHHRHVFQAAKPERTKPAIVSYNGVAFAYLSASGIRRDLPKARQKNGIRAPREARRTAPKAKVVWTMVSKDEANALVRLPKVMHYGTVEHSTKEHL